MGGGRGDHGSPPPARPRRRRPVPSRVDPDGRGKAASEKLPQRPRMSAPPATERRLIEIIRRAVRRAPGVRVGIGDDCAVLEPDAGSLLLATTDLLIEDVHFRRRWATPTDIGWKSLAVNVSDIAAMGGRPRWALIALACPDAVRVDEADAFYARVHTLATEYDVVIVGADTTASLRR